MIKAAYSQKIQRIESCYYVYIRTTVSSECNYILC